LVFRLIVKKTYVENLDDVEERVGVVVLPEGEEGGVVVQNGNDDCI
jgi:hypothetical protein